MTSSLSISAIESTYKITSSISNKLDHSSLDLFMIRNNIRKVSDLMIGSHQFDIENMTRTEKDNLKYLVLSTDEIKKIMNKHVRSIYLNSKSWRLRDVMSYEDFYQTCFYKLLLNDGILRFNADYSLECAINCWICRTAMWKAYKKVNEGDLVCVLDMPIRGSENAPVTVGDIIMGANVEGIYGINKDPLYDCNDYQSLTVKDPSNIKEDSKRMIKLILSKMDGTPNRRLSVRTKDVHAPLSESLLAWLIVEGGISKKELAKMIFNDETDKLVSNQIFNKFYKHTILHIAKVIDQESKKYGETFSIDEAEL